MPLSKFLEKRKQPAFTRQRGAGITFFEAALAGLEGRPGAMQAPTTRFCLNLHQNTAGEWLLRTPAGLDLPATHSEISLWLDLEALRFQLSSYETLIIS